MFTLQLIHIYDNWKIDKTTKIWHWPMNHENEFKVGRHHRDIYVHFTIILYTPNIVDILLLIFVKNRPKQINLTFSYEPWKYGDVWIRMIPPKHKINVNLIIIPHIKYSWPFVYSTWHPVKNTKNNTDHRTI